MKLLLDHNLSHRLIPSLAEIYPGSAHVRALGLRTASDEAIWDYARDHGFAIISKDADLHQRSLVLGAPPKLIWIRRGNCSTSDILDCLTGNRAQILSFDADRDAAFLVIR